MTTTTRRVALFGGSFDPPHVCHLMAATWALSTRDIDEIWWVPTYQHAFGKDLRPWEDRVAMVNATIGNFASVMKLCTIEEQLGGVSRTIDTVRALRERHPDACFSLLVGADIVDQLAAWKNADELLKLVELHVIGRDGYADPATHDLRLPDISSTALRAAIREGNHAFYRARMPAGVTGLIEAEGWYRDDAER